MSLLEDIMTQIRGLDDFDGDNNRFITKTLHAAGLVDDCAGSRRVAIASGLENTLVIIISGGADLVRKLGGAQERLRYHQALLIDDNEQSGIIVTFPIRGQSLQRFGYLIRDLVMKIKSKPDLTSSGICDVVRPHLSSAIDIGNILDESKQMGLYGELLLLEDLIRNRQGLAIEKALDTWQDAVEVIEGGAGTETRRDFTGNNIAIEAKATGKGSRLHVISNWNQVHPQTGESLYLFSCAAKPARSGTIRLIDQYRKVREALGEDVPESDLKSFHDKLRGQKFLVSDLDKYELSTPFMVEDFEAGLIIMDENIRFLRPVTQLDGERVEGSFYANEGPESPHITPRSISYELDLTSCTASIDDGGAEGGNGQFIPRGCPRYLDILHSMMTGNN